MRKTIIPFSQITIAQYLIHKAAKLYMQVGFVEFQRFCPKYQEEATQTVGEMKKRIKRGGSKKREEGM